MRNGLQCSSVIADRVVFQRLHFLGSNGCDSDTGSRDTLGAECGRGTASTMLRKPAARWQNRNTLHLVRTLINDTHLTGRAGNARRSATNGGNAELRAVAQIAVVGAICIVITDAFTRVRITGDTGWASRVIRTSTIGITRINCAEIAVITIQQRSPDTRTVFAGITGSTGVVIVARIVIRCEHASRNLVAGIRRA